MNCTSLEIVIKFRHLKIKVTTSVICVKRIKEILATITLHKLGCFSDHLKPSCFTSQNFMSVKCGFLLENILKQ
jgi:hypothetical protein